MTWSIADARAHLADVLQAAAEAPQYVSSRGRPIAVIVAPEEYEVFDAWRRSRPACTMAEALDAVQQACAEDGYELEIPARADRPNAFLEGR